MDVCSTSVTLDRAGTCGVTAEPTASPCRHGLGSRLPEGSVTTTVDAAPSSDAHDDLLAFVEGEALRDFSRRLGAATSVWGA